MRRKLPFPFTSRRRGIGVIGLGILLLIGLAAGEDQSTGGGDSGGGTPPPATTVEEQTDPTPNTKRRRADGPKPKKRVKRKQRKRKPGLRAQVVDVADGDTITVRLPNGREESIRYIGIDTPESVHPTEPVGCFGLKASYFNSKLVQGRQVRLRFDTEKRDYYGRLLAYVYRGGVFVNAELVKRGFARSVYYSPNGAFRSLFESLQRRAARKGRGLWGACGR